MGQRLKEAACSSSQLGQQLNGPALFFAVIIGIPVWGEEQQKQDAEKRKQQISKQKPAKEKKPEKTPNAKPVKEVKKQAPKKNETEGQMSLFDLL